MIRFLSDDAQLQHPPELLVEMYKKMFFLRQADQKAVNLQRTGQLGTYPMFVGHEAIDIGAGMCLTAADVFVPYYRDPGILLIRGMELSDMYAYWGGNELASSVTPNTDLPICIPIGTQYSQAAGVAAALKYKKTKGMVLVCGGDGSTSKGDIYEAMNVASLWSLPIVFLIKNNQYAISTPSCKQTAGSIYTRASGFNMQGMLVDGNDVLAVYDTCNKAFAKARQNKGPVLIEAVTYRIGCHTTSDNSTLYRDPNEVSQAWKNEPISKFRSYLIKHGLWDKEKELNLIDTTKKEVECQVEKYLNYKQQTVSDLFDFMFDDTSHLSDQRDACVKLNPKGSYI